ncbi:ATP-binding protein [Streptomyces sp. NPDC086091]|uniref:ATP-binding protein n=1 Tax=Streptomyces sp. NPDC086091 TaxID=3365751 RepID=UPI003829FE22
MHIDTASCQSPTTSASTAAFVRASPAELAYGVTLPAAPRSPGVARAVARLVLPAHGLAEVIDPAVQVVSELTACACRFSASEVYLSLRCREDTLRVTVYYSHARHANVRLGAACDLHRRMSLRVLDRVVRACRGEWGIGGDRSSGAGTRMWANLPLSGAGAFLEGHRLPGRCRNLT